MKRIKLISIGLLFSLSLFIAGLTSANQIPDGLSSIADQQNNSQNRNQNKNANNRNTNANTNGNTNANTNANTNVNTSPTPR